MAKGKHAAALFEVINKGKKEETSRGSILRTPSWWFKNRTSAEPTKPDKAPPQPPAQPSPAAQTPPPAPPATLPPTPAPEASAESTPDENDPTIGHRLAGPLTDRPSGTPQTSRKSHHTGDAGGPALAVDPAKKQIALRLTYTTAGIGAFALLVLISLAYLIGRQVNTGPAPAIASRSTDEVRQDDPSPQVLDITRGTSTSSMPPAQQPQPTQPAPTHSTPPPAGTTGQDPAPATDDDGPRTIGLNYVIIQSYREEEMAQRYAQMLTQEGIRCTVEQDLPNWSRGGPWYSIVGTRGFARIRNSPDYDAYIQSIRRANDRHGLTGIRRFDPHPYHWKGR